MHRRAVLGLGMAGLSGVLYGSINVLAKEVDLAPLAKSAVAYLVSAAVLAPFLRGAWFRRADLPRILAMGLLGGGAAPICLFYGLRETAAADAGLLLTVEMAATGALAFLFLRERFRRGEAAGLLCLLAAAVVVALASAGADEAGASQSSPKGVLLVLASAVLWGVDNAVSAHLVGTYRPQHLIAVKGLLGAAAAGTALAFLDPGPAEPSALLRMAALGVAAIALSSLLFYTALGRVGAARTSAMNVATTALVGAAGGALRLGERLQPFHAVALAFVLAGAWLLARHHSHPGRSAGRAPAPPAEAAGAAGARPPG